MSYLTRVLAVAGFLCLTSQLDAQEQLRQHDHKQVNQSILNTDNLVAWCIVPFDAAERGPIARAEMLHELRIKRCAYDWRKKHVPTFEKEILAYKKYDIDFFAFWGMHEQAFELFRKHELTPQIWQTLSEPSGNGDRDSKIKQATKQLLPLAESTKQLGSKLALYNHGGWGGEPSNLVSVCKALHQLGQTHVGIVYNFHHGHDHIDDWAESLKLMLPYLHCLNLNGMNTDAQPKILGIGRGEHEQAMIRTIVESGYRGRIGILDHRPEIDARESLQDNLDGLAKLRTTIGSPLNLDRQP